MKLCEPRLPLRHRARLRFKRWSRRRRSKPPKADIADQLTRLADLRDHGILSDAEFETQKSKILAES
jgi:hypothetical protein